MAKASLLSSQTRHVAYHDGPWVVKRLMLETGSTTRPETNTRAPSLGCEYGRSVPSTFHQCPRPVFSLVLLPVGITGPYLQSRICRRYCISPVLGLNHVFHRRIPKYCQYSAAEVTELPIDQQRQDLATLAPAGSKSTNAPFRARGVRTFRAKEKQAWRNQDLQMPARDKESRRLSANKSSLC